MGADGRPGWDAALADLEARGRLRRLEPRAGLDFASNDYLGLAQSGVLRDAVAAEVARGVPIGSGGSRLLRGNHPEHETLETEAAAFFGAEAALYLGSGFMANAALLATLPQRGDIVLYDELIHASSHDGMRGGRAESRRIRHNDAGAFEDAVRAWRAAGNTGRPWIAVESLYSMDGDRAPLDDLAAIAGRYDAMLVIDEAHATGVLGPEGRGLAAHLEGRPDVVTVHTCGKALGVAGGLVCATRGVRDFLVNRARPFIYATAPSPLMAAAVRAALRISRQEPERRQQLAALVAHTGAELKRCADMMASGSHIVPVIVGAETRAVALARTLQSKGFDIRAIRPPTVPEGTSRLRLPVTLNVDAADVTRLAEALGEALADLPR